MLFEPLKIRGEILKNRIMVSPMCQYSSRDGFANDWHLVHLGSRAAGGAAVVFTEATAVEARGRISPYDLGIWKEEHIEPLQRIVRFLESQDALSGIQLAHAGRRASTSRPWDGGAPVDKTQNGWVPVAPSSVPYPEDGYPYPVHLSVDDIAEIIGNFAAAARRALAAGFDIVEIHSAHGYLLHEFLSPITNKRRDEYGGSFENRIRMLVDVTRAVRRVWPERLPLFVRLSCTDWLDPDGWNLEQSVELAKVLVKEGVDMIDCSSGGLEPQARIPAGPGYQVRFSERIRREAGIRTGAVGLITSAIQAETILKTGQADAVFLGRQFLRDPYWGLHAASELHVKPTWPLQYGRAA